MARLDVADACRDALKSEKPAGSVTVFTDWPPTVMVALAGVPSWLRTKPSMVVVKPLGMTLMRVTEVAPSFPAVMKAVPGPTAVTRPSGPTAATAVLLVR